MKGLKKIFSRLFKRSNLILFTLVLILSLGFTAMTVNIRQLDFVFGYDEVEDLIHVRRIVVNHDLLVIGKAIYGNPDIRHGVLSYYFMAPGFLLFDGDPQGVAYWDAFISLFAILAVYLLGKSIFKDSKLSLIAASVYAFSYLAVEYSGWVSHPTFAPVFVSLFFLGLWKMFEKNSWGLFLSLTFLGLSIQSDLLFIYLIPIFVLFLIIFRPKLPNLKIIVLSLASLLVTLSTIIYTEIKFNFSGVKTILNFSSSFDEGRVSFYQRLKLFLIRFFETISYNITSKPEGVGVVVGALIVLIAFFYLLRSKKESRYRVLFLLFYLFSPAIILFLGYHDKPWTFLGILPAISLIIAFAVGKLKNNFFIFPAAFIIILLGIRGIYENKIKINRSW